MLRLSANGFLLRISGCGSAFRSFNIMAPLFFDLVRALANIYSLGDVPGVTGVRPPGLQEFGDTVSPSSQVKLRKAGSETNISLEYVLIDSAIIWTPTPTLSNASTLFSELRSCYLAAPLTSSCHHPIFHGRIPISA